MLASSLVFIVLSSRYPIALYPDAGHDDALFLLHAQRLLSGRWLGDYSQFTLMKGPGYAVFLAVNRLLRLPITVSHAILYASGCAVLATALGRLVRSRWAVALVFLAMLWHAVTLSWVRVIRDDIVAAQVLLLLGCLIHLLYETGNAKRRLWWSVAAGAVAGWFWLTREDGIWILPGVGLLVAGRLWQSRNDWPDLRRVGVSCLVALVAFGSVLGTFAGGNRVAYGRFETVDFRGKSFESALRALQRVRAGEPVPYVPVPRKVRDEVEQVSPTFARLQPEFNGTEMSWTLPGCAVYLGTCGDYAGGWFVWALRDAAQKAGFYRTPRIAARSYAAIAREVEAACADGRLTCARAMPGVMPAVTQAQWRKLPDHLAAALAVLLWKQPAQPLENSGPVAMQYWMWKFVGKPLPAMSRQGHADTANLQGWFYGPDKPWLMLVCRSGTSDVQHMSSPDIAKHFEDPAATDRRFAVAFRRGDSCRLSTASSAGAQPVVDLEQLGAAPFRRSIDGIGTIHVDNIDSGTGFKREDIGSGFLAFQHAMDAAWRVLSPVLLSAGLLAFLLASAWVVWKRRYPPVLLLAAAAWLMVICRVAILVLVDISSFQAINVQYMQAAFPLLVFASAASIVSVLQTVSLRGRNASDHARQS